MSKPDSPRKTARARTATTAPDPQSRKSAIVDNTAIAATRENSPRGKNNNCVLALKKRVDVEISLPAPTLLLKRPACSVAMLRLMGHRESCIRLIRGGKTASCDCNIRRLDDPAVAVGVAIAFARISMMHKAPLPAVVMEFLSSHIRDGEPACIMVAQWLVACDLLELRSLPHAIKRRIR